MFPLIPQPQRITLHPGVYLLPEYMPVRVPGPEYADSVFTVAHAVGAWQMDAFAAGMHQVDLHAVRGSRRLRRDLHPDEYTWYELAPGRAGEDCAIAVTPAADLPAQGYRLRISPAGIAIEAGTPQALHYAGCTLGQIAASAEYGTLPCLEIEDWPDIPVRGLYYDISRGRVPQPGALLDQAKLLGDFKLNQLQLYIEHTFRFQRHPAIGLAASPLGPGDIEVLDRRCAASHIDLVPSLACFGHMSKVLRLPQYSHLAEDWGALRYVDPQAQAPQWEPGWSIAPANPKSYTFLAELFDEFLPCFSSQYFNVCCDETYDLGWGQSFELAQRIGKGRLYLDHLKRLRELAQAHGKRIMCWGDIIRSHPQLAAQLPRDITVLDWGYDAALDFKRIRDFTALGLDAYGCPTVCGYVSLFPRLHESLANIAGWAGAVREHGAAGLLNTDWGDGGHYNFNECAWPGYLSGAEQAWNTRADRSSFLSRFCSLFLLIDSPAFVHALVRLGDVAQAHVRGFYQSFWRHVFFASPGDAVLAPGPRPASLSTLGELHAGELSATAELGRETHDMLCGISAVLDSYTDNARYDPHGILPYWSFSVDTLKHAARKLAALGEGGYNTPASRRELRLELGRLRDRFEALWTARNQPSEIGITLMLYDNAMAGLE